ncbi:immunity protein Imm33 domain-containing protein [Chryseobacterium viscerum]|uniref:Imm33-like domain-containing protein n=1 Tax=Chryseobacterium viscerum TaxID=1037377 RepID=A0A316WRS3_9FLAO|nr:hypothetical protein [Chryseobacterium viscerum]PWN64101.1 hypothetical protein C1634_005770 [Chryseobacterium viscerum]
MNNIYIEKQEKICRKYSQIADFVELDSLIALGKNFNPSLQINGLRHPRTETLNGWYIWSGEDFNPEDFDFFNPSHTHHLLDKASFVIKYLGLPPGNRFLIDSKGYEDVWFDESLLLED